MIRPYYLIDTNILSEVLKIAPSKNVCSKLEEYNGLCSISATTWHELLFGAAIMPESKKKEIFKQFIFDKVQQFYPIVAYDEHAAFIHADIRANLQKRGNPMPFQDTQIAAIAIANNMIIVTRNTKHFAPIQQVANLMLENWFEDS